jgi:uncharacterized RDD family membrane protein YckC
MKKYLIAGTVLLVFVSIPVGVISMQVLSHMTRAWSWRHDMAFAVYAQDLQAPDAPAASAAPQAPARPRAPRPGQTPPPVPAPAAPAVPEGPEPPLLDDQQDFEFGRERNTVRLGQDLTLGSGDSVRDAVVIFGNATISGHVTGNLLVILGTAKLTSTAVIDGDFVAIGGNATVEGGATAQRDVVIFGGKFDAPAGFVPGGEQVIVGSGLLGSWFEGLVPYLSRGLLWGRVIVPDLAWVWGIVALFFLVYLTLNVVFDRPVAICATTVRARPLTAFGTGLLVLLLLGPVVLLLAVSVVGIAVIPFLICALIAAGILGKVAIARAIGMSVVPEDAEEHNRVHGMRSFVIGFAVLSIAYMIPVIGLITWAIAGVIGLGAATLAFMSAYRRENPVKPPVMPPVVPPPPAPPVYEHVAPPVAAPLGESSSAACQAGAAAPPPPPFMPPAMPAYAGAPSVLLSMPRAWFRDRLAAFVLDVILVAITISFLDSINVIEEEVIPVFVLIYMIGMWTWKQTTVGGTICQLRLVRVDGSPLSFADALVRGLSGIFSLVVFFLGALWILRDPERQAWHDKIAGTYVVKVPRNWPL